jgi:predicted Rossmann fold flavoprotein
LEVHFAGPNLNRWQALGSGATPGGYSEQEPMPSSLRQFDVVVLGAGAAGLMCAAVAGARGRRVAVLDHNGQPGRKILVSGGGRCNFTNLHCEPSNFLSENPHFASSALALFQPRHFLELVERYGIPWHEKTQGQLFCNGSARAVLEMLLAECERSGVEMVLNTRGIEVATTSGGFCVKTSAGEFQSEALVVATGGLSIPKLGATGIGYELARQFGLAVVAPRPALVPLVLGGEEASWTELAGVAAEVAASVEGACSKAVRGAGSRREVRFGVRGGVRFRDSMLVTHRGLSGPAILQASSYWRPGEALLVDFAPDLPATGGLLEALRQPGARRDSTAYRQALRETLPQRLANHLAVIGAPRGWSNAALEACERELRRWAFHPVGTEGFEKAEVTAGGVDTRGLQARTLEARAVQGLFFIGEVVDVTGQLGGYNFQWAWSSAVAAGRAV